MLSFVLSELTELIINGIKTFPFGGEHNYNLRMKIAILGTKGIPNNYGGFEQFAENISVLLVKFGHDVTVYNPHFHPYDEPIFNGVQIKKIFSPEKQIGASANFIYDYLCLKNALNDDYDVILECGYHSNAPSYYLMGNKKSSILVTNMDGLEWKRSKWGKATKWLIKKLELLAIKKSHYLISDNVGIQQYYKESYGVDSFYIAYGADLVTEYNVLHLEKYTLKPQEYLLLIARLEPENNIELILDSYIMSGSKFHFLVIGNCTTRYGQFLQKKYAGTRIRFVGGIYNMALLDSLRKYALGYFHGHSVGGTNPSLLEAMASQAFIIAHNNEFNKSVLQHNALYFSNVTELSDVINSLPMYSLVERNKMIRRNCDLILTNYSWTRIAKEYEKVFFEITNKKVL